MFKFIIPYSAKVKTPLKGVVFKLLDTMEPALDAKSKAPRGGLHLALHGSFLTLTSINKLLI